MLLSACLIVKNEEFTIKRCLDSIQDIADEIILVDTGSSDQTISIAQTYNVKVYTYTWDGDFSHARNESLRHAKGDFVLVIDADEYLDVASRLQIRDLLSTSQDEAYYVSIKNYVGSIRNFKEVRPASIVRIFRNRHRYEGKVHEQVIPSILSSGSPISASNIIVHHLGYLDEIVALHNKIERNTVLIEQELRDNPNSLFHRSNMMVELIRQGRYKEALTLSEETINLIEKNPQDRIDHILLRVLILHATCLWETGQHADAVQSLKETGIRAPGLADIWFRMAHMLILDGSYFEALEPLQKCILLGEPRDVLIDTIEGSGSFLAFMELSQVWSHLGDDQKAQEFLIQAFFPKPNITMLSFDLIYYLRNEPTALSLFAEERIRIYPEEYCNYAEQYANWGLPNARQLVDRVKQTVPTSLALHRAEMTLLRASDSDIEFYVESNPCEEVYLLWAIYLMENKEWSRAHEALIHAGTRGEYLSKLMDISATEMEWVWESTLFLRDFVAIGAKELLRTWLPHAKDKTTSIEFLRHSPLQDILYNIEWPGDNELECEFNAIRYFRAQDLNLSAHWLEKGLAFQPTVTKILVECDLALAHGSPDYAKKVLHFGRTLFTDSKLLQQVESQLGVYQPTVKRLEELLMNPADIYRTRSVQTMPLNIQLAQLHNRGALLTKQVREDVHAGRLAEARNNIEELQNIITFLRSSLNPQLEVSAVTDQTYAFYYKITVRWFIQPNSVDDEFDAMLTFWESWSETWLKVRTTTP